MNPESITQMAKSAEKAGNPQKSQAELRATLEQKLMSLKPVMQEGIKEYKQALKDNIFEDVDGEPDGSGEQKPSP
jgi:hypothetical protein